jgi:hypothetical protein
MDLQTLTAGHWIMWPEINPKSPTFYYGTDIWAVGVVLHDMMFGPNKLPNLPKEKIF